MKLKRTEKVRRTTLAPHGLVEKDNYYIIGDKYVRVLTVSAMPKAITEGFLHSLSVHLIIISIFQLL